MTIDELKRALVEVRDICKNNAFCQTCPLNKKFGSVIVCRFHEEKVWYPYEWDVDDWKEDSNATD